MLSRETSENAVSYRVAACRRRLRNVRAGQRTSVQIKWDGTLGDMEVSPVLIVGGFVRSRKSRPTSSQAIGLLVNLGSGTKDASLLAATGEQNAEIT
jgi:hypothetical protein